MMEMETIYEKMTELLEKGDKEGAVRYSLELMDNDSLSIKDLYINILTPALNSITCNEHEDPAACIWKEHISSSIARTIVENCYLRVLNARNEDAINRQDTAIVLCPPKEQHELGARMVADFFTLAGFHTLFVGRDTPKKSFLSAIDILKPKYLIISITNKYNVFHAQRVIGEIREHATHDVTIMVGGGALKDTPELYKTMGADIFLEDVEMISNLP